jgi:YD repeat-containing protein
LTKRDARNITTTYGYDALNRITGKSYSDGTSGVTYTYDDPNVANAKGQVTKIVNGSSTTSYTAYDPMGRVTASSQTTLGQTYGFSYSYNLAGALTSEIYPSGRVINTSYDPMNQATKVSGVLNGQGKDYAWSISYAPHGGLAGIWYGGNIARVYQYNQQLQVKAIWDSVNNVPDHYLFVLYPDWGTTNDNGKLYGGQTYVGDSVPFASLTRSDQSYAYDGVNRLTGVWDSGYWRTFGYDTWGNMWVTGNGGVPLAGNTPTANVYSGNRIGGASYDAAGNQLVVNGDTLAYDAENRQSSATDGVTHGVETYEYDGEGRRVKKTIVGGAVDDVCV